MKNTCQSTCSRTTSLAFPSAVSTSKATICDVLRDSVPFVHFKKHEKHVKSVTFSKSKSVTLVTMEECYF